MTLWGHFIHTHILWGLAKTLTQLYGDISYTHFVTTHLWVHSIVFTQTYLWDP